jgi:hypothetical protein
MGEWHVLRDDGFYYVIEAIVITSPLMIGRHGRHGTVNDARAPAPLSLSQWMSLNKIKRKRRLGGTN